MMINMNPQITSKKIMNLFLFSIILLILVLSLPSMMDVSASSRQNVEKRPVSLYVAKTKLDATYYWIWEEYQDTAIDGAVIGDDPVTWGEDLGAYHNYTETVNRLLSLNSTFPDIVDVLVYGQSYQGRNLYAVRITNETAPDDNKEIVLVVAEHHAREMITVESALFFMELLVYKWNIEQDTGNPGMMTEILNTKEVYIVPMVNPDGTTVLHRNPWQRKNLDPIDDDGDGRHDDENEINDENGNGYVEYYFQIAQDIFIDVGYEATDLDGDGKEGEDLPGGVDINRNYGFQWGNLTGASNKTTDDDYFGSAPFSEPETQALADFEATIADRMIVAVSLHSGIKAILRPWSYTTEDSPHEEPAAKLSDELSNITGFPSYSTAQLYPASGEWGDWLYSQYGVIAYTWEIYYDEDAYVAVKVNGTMGSELWSIRGIWDFFNPDDIDIMTVNEQVYRGLEYLLMLNESYIYNFKPNVQIVTPNGFEVYNDTDTITIEWNASDRNNDSLTFDLYYSSDNGATWHEIISGLESTTSYVWSIKNLENSTKYRIKIIAKDKYSSSEDISDGTFAIGSIQIGEDEEPPINIRVGPDWPSVIIPALIMTITLVASKKRKMNKS